MRSIAALLCATSLLAGCAAAGGGETAAVSKAAVGRAEAPTAAAAANKPAIGSFGFDEAGMNKSVAPGNSFYDFANGNWEKTTPIPADRSNYGNFTVLEDLSFTRTNTILEEAA